MLTESEKRAIRYLEKELLLHMDMIEPIRRGSAEILYHQDDGVLMKELASKTFMMSVKDQDRAEAIVSGISFADLFVVHQESSIPIVQKKFGLKTVMGCVQAVYLHTEPLVQREEIDIRCLGREWKDFITAHYHTVDDADYIESRLAGKTMYGAFFGAELAGFIGMHEEGTIGLLEVLPAFRRRGIGMALEIFMINQNLQRGWIPFGQIKTGNSVSMELSRKLGMEVSEQQLFWLS